MPFATGGDVGSPSVTYKQPKIAVVALAAVDSAGGLFSFQNPESGAILVTNVILEVTTVANAACKADCGMTPTNGTTLSDSLLDGIDLRSATGVFGLLDGDAPGAGNGKGQQKVAAGKWVTGSVASGASAGVVGNVYITYIPL